MFNFGKHYFGIRLETFYNKAYKEPYYILFLRKNIDRIEKPEKVDKHTVPKFVPVEVLAARFLPNNMEVISTLTLFKSIKTNSVYIDIFTYSS